MPPPLSFGDERSVQELHIRTCRRRNSMSPERHLVLRLLVEPVARVDLRRHLERDPAGGKFR